MTRDEQLTEARKTLEDLGHEDLDLNDPVQVAARLQSSHEAAQQAWRRVGEFECVLRQFVELDIPTREHGDECTAWPLFFVEQRRCVWYPDCTYDSQKERMVDDEGEEITEEQAVGRSLAEFIWCPWRLYFTREEANDVVENVHHHGTLRSYAFPTHGSLAELMEMLSTDRSGKIAVARDLALRLLLPHTAKKMEGELKLELR